MIIARLNGGLGNQMFQYACARAVALKNNTEIILDDGIYLKDPLRKYELDCFEFSKNTLNGINRKRIIPYSLPLMGQYIKKVSTLIIYNKLAINSYKEKYFHFDENVLRLKGDYYLWGFWQSYKYFEMFNNIIRKDFTFKHKIPLGNEKYAREMKESVSVGIHIRRGDYLSNTITNSIHGVLPIQYYRDAISLIHNKYGACKLFIFSDDIEWVKNFLSKEILLNDYRVVKDVHTSSHTDLFLMSQCQHNIIANSSFSWWAAWLNGNEEKMVVAPQKWFADSSIDTKDLLPDSWIRI
jgi:hypothetical protein